MTTALTVRPLTPDVWGMLSSVAKAAYESRKFGVTEGEAAIKLLFCFENGLPLTAANTSLLVVNGRMEVMGNLIASKLRSHGSYDYKIKELNNKGCTIQILRKVADEWITEGEASFTEEDAKRIGLNTKDNYKNYPEDMYFNRAISRAYKRYAPDIFTTPVYVIGEISNRVESDVIEGQWQVHTEPTKVLTLETLTAQYDVESILEANNGTIPSTQDEIETVAKKLESEVQNV